MSDTTGQDGEDYVATYSFDLAGNRRQKVFNSANNARDETIDYDARDRLPATHRKTVRTTNLCARSFVEQRRRAKVIPRFRSERECLKLMFASLWRASEWWRKVKFTPLEPAQLEQYIKARQAAGKKVRDLFAAA